MRLKAIEEENRRLKKALEEVVERNHGLESQRNVLANGLRRICTAGSLHPGDPLDDAYLQAGRGYGGLQQMAVKALEIAEVER